MRDEVRAADGLGKTFRLSKNLDVQLGLRLFCLLSSCSDQLTGQKVHRFSCCLLLSLTGQKGSQVLCTCLAIEAGVETLPK